jgi:SAM-dependent methyltransferase
VPGGVDHHDRGAQEIVIYDRLREAMPRGLRAWVQHFEVSIERAVSGFGGSIAEGARVLDAGAGEGNYRKFFAKHRYCGLDLGVGDAAWDYSRLDVVGDLARLPFPDGTFEAAINIVTLEHVTDPSRVVCELARTLVSGGRLLLIAPLEWEEHQTPHDYFRYTRYGLEFLLRKGGFTEIAIEPVGGFFRLLSRRMFNALQFFPGPLIFVAAIFFVPPALVLPAFDGLDRRKNFTPGFICQARKS